MNDKTITSNDVIIDQIVRTAHAFQLLQKNAYLRTLLSLREELKLLASDLALEDKEETDDIPF